MYKLLVIAVAIWQEFRNRLREDAEDTMRKRDWERKYGHKRASETAS